MLRQLELSIAILNSQSVPKTMVQLTLGLKQFEPRQRTYLFLDTHRPRPHAVYGQTLGPCISGSLEGPSLFPVFFTVFKSKGCKRHLGGSKNEATPEWMVFYRGNSQKNTTLKALVFLSHKHTGIVK